MSRVRRLPAVPSGDAVLQRFAALASLDGKADAALAAALHKVRRLPPRAELQAEGQRITEPLILVEGWAARTRVLEDGRRQIVNFTLPGDLVGMCEQEAPIASSTVVALTAVAVCPAPCMAVPATLRQAYAMSRALEEAYLIGQVARLGRLTAQERIEDLILELLERLELCGLADDGRFGLPLTQEQFADAVGLTPVHVNRMLQQARLAGGVTWRGGDVTVHDPDQTRRRIGRQRVRVSAAMPAL